MATMVRSMAVEGIDGFEVEVEATTIRGQQQAISIIGLGDQAVKEAGERIQAALEFCGYEIPKEKVIISLAPGNRRKRGSHYDLAMTVALLLQTDQISAKNLERYALIGELSLNGRLRPCNGILPMVTEAKHCGIKAVIIPFENWKEAESVTGIEVFGMRTLRDTIQFLEGRLKPSKKEEIISSLPEEPFCIDSLDFADVKGQQELINVQHVDYFQLADEKSNQTSAELRSRVEKARAIQQIRFSEEPLVNCNAQMTTSMIKKYCRLNEETTRILKDASEKYGYSARVIHKLLRMARTAADLRGAENIEREDIIFVLNCRDLDRSNNNMYVIR